MLFRSIKTAIDTFGGLDVLVNNAGILRDRMIVTMTERDWDAVIGVHLSGTFAVLHHAAAYWRQRAKELGFAFHSPAGEVYWDERACYAFSLSEIETEIEDAFVRSVLPLVVQARGTQVLHASAVAFSSNRERGTARSTATLCERRKAATRFWHWLPIPAITWRMRPACTASRLSMTSARVLPSTCTWELPPAIGRRVVGIRTVTAMASSSVCAGSRKTTPTWT